MSSIVFKTLKYKNILSSGNTFTTYNFQKAKTSLIIGSNGSGKSTFLDALAFALYGKPFRNINKPQLPNSINKKEMIVELNFSVGKTNYKIIRGMKPGKFEIYENGNLINQNAAAKDYQKYLEENILKMSFKSFGQVVVLGSSTFIPFMQLDAASRRQIIENLLDIEIFTTMNNILKSKIKINKEELQKLEADMRVKENDIAWAKKNNAKIQEMNDESEDKLKERVKGLLGLIEENTASLEKIHEDMSKVGFSQKDKTELEAQYKEAEQKLYGLNSDIKTNSKNVKFFESNDECFTCQQDIDPKFKASKIKSYNKIIANTNKEVESIKASLTEMDKARVEMQKKESLLADYALKITVHDNAIKSAKRELADIKKEIQGIKAKNEEKLVDIGEYENELAIIMEAHRIASEDKEILEVAGIMLKDTGIKAKVIKQYVPIINQVINKYLQSMDFFVDFQIDETFKETIKSRYRDIFSYASFSEGEKARIDIALLMTWREIAKMRNSVSTNLLIMDEIFDGSLDVDGTASLLGIFRKHLDNTNLFVISHNTENLREHFDSVIQFKKVKDFSVGEEVK